LSKKVLSQIQFKTGMTAGGRTFLYLIVSFALSFLAYRNFLMNENYMNSFNGQPPSKGVVYLNAAFISLFYGALVFVIFPLNAKRIVD